MFCRVTAAGRLGSDPRVINTRTGRAMTIFSLATRERYGQKQGPRTVWHTVVCFDGRAEFANEYLKKGQMVFVEGRLSYTEFTDREGRNRMAADIVADHLWLRPSPSEAAQAEAGQTVDPADPEAEKAAFEEVVEEGDMVGDGYRIAQEGAVMAG